MLGTVWVAPGEGATISQLRLALTTARAVGGDRRMAESALDLLGSRMDVQARTRLALTGEFLQSYDCDRIQAMARER